MDKNYKGKKVSKKNNLISYYRFLPQLIRMRIYTKIYWMFLKITGQKAPKRVMFLHLPKTAGSTARQYAEACVGSFRSKHAQRINEFIPGKPLEDHELEKLKTSRFISGHFSWRVIDLADADENTFIFTTLRKPYDRMRSMYFYVRYHPIGQIPRGLLTVYATGELPPEQFFRNDDKRFHHILNNYMVRAIAGDMRVPDTDEGWDELLQRAKDNLLKIDHVCFTETFEEDFLKILKDVKLPRILPIHRQNETKNLLESDVEQAFFKRPFSDETNEAIAPLIKYDQQLYDYACEMREAGKLRSL